jgi:cysteinyl-tRNA synthetase
MDHNISLYNSLNRQKEKFTPIHPGYLGMYVCGPTVYSDVHLGNCRTFVNFDLIFRYFKYCGFKVRYVRNITDVGHLLDDGEDRIMKGARLEQIEPMEVVQKYANGFQHMMRVFNTIPPSIEPRATGHIVEQIEMIQEILDNGFAYNVDGSIYFDTIKYSETHKDYGHLSGRKIEDLLAVTRDDLKKQSEKKHPSDFALWIKASEDHIMRWNSPWSIGFPGWHLECSVMSTKYLGQEFDIHGGGTDLKFPHHENEIAQNVGACGHAPAKYWLHTNMLLMNGRKMSKSDGNTISPQQLFTGESEHISKSYSPMVIRFFFLQAHYRSTLDLTDDALLAAEKAYKRLFEANGHLQAFPDSYTSTNNDLDQKINTLLDQAIADMDDDFNAPKALSRLFELAPIINSYQQNSPGSRNVSQETLKRLKEEFQSFLIDIFGLKAESSEANDKDTGRIEGLMELILDLRQNARTNKDWPIADKIRDKLSELKIQVKDGKEGTHWTLN